MSGLASAWSDFKETFFPSVAYAEEDEEKHEDDAPEESQDKSDDSEEQSEDKDDAPEEESEDKSEESEDKESGDDSEESGDDDGDDDEDEDDDDDDDEDEDELVDPLDALREKYTETVCHPFKHHFDECVERVTKAQQEPDYEDREYKEDCIEEFFHLQHCLNDHISPVLFSKLK